MLRSRSIELISVVEHTYRNVEAFLLIPLVEELIKDAPSPSLARLERFQRVGDVCPMQEKLAPLLLFVLEHFGMVLVKRLVNLALSSLRLQDMLLHLAEAFQKFHHIEVLGIIWCNML